MTDSFRRQLVKDYSSDDTSYASTTIQRIDDHFASMHKSASAIDPARLGSRSVLISRLRNDLLEKSGPIRIKNDPVGFNFMSAKEQLRFQAQSRVNGTNKWVLSLTIIPDNISNLAMSVADVIALKKMRAKVDGEKLREDVDEVDLSLMIGRLMPTLLKPSDEKWNALVAALLLATGRRTIEVMKTAKFYLAASQSSTGYVCMFSGQAKDSLQGSEDYEIPLLAPFFLVNQAMVCLRKRVDCTKIDSEEVNALYAKGVNNYVNRICSTNPHALRAIYAQATYILSKTKMTFLGYVSKVLGHSTPTNAAYYSRIKLENCDGPYVVSDDYVTPIEDTDEKPAWKITCAADAKRVKSIEEMILHRAKLTASAIRSFGGGQMSTIQRVMLNNKDRIDAYMQSLN